MTHVLPIVLLLDLSSDNPPSETEIREQLPEEERSRVRFVRATEHGAKRSPRGSPTVWYPCADAVVKMVDHARNLAKEARTDARYYVAGHAGLPLFAQLGCEVSSWADVTLLNRRKDGVWDVLSLRASSEGSTQPFFTLSGTKRNDQAGQVSVIVATSPPRQEEAVRSYTQVQNEVQAGVVTALASAAGSPAAILDKSNVAQAAREIDALFTGLSDRFPNATGFSLFIDGPASLAFLVGRAINPKVLPRPARVPNHDRINGGGYYPALSLPYKIPRAGAAAPGTLVAILSAAADVTYRDELIGFLAPAVRKRALTLWHGDSAPVGSSIEDDAREHLERARLVVVLVSAQLLLSERHTAWIEQITRSQAATGVHILPVRLKASGIEESCLAGRQALPRGVASVTEAVHRDNVWMEVTDEIGKSLDSIANSKS